jgi:hypothetical protein
MHGALFSYSSFIILQYLSVTFSASPLCLSLSIDTFVIEFFLYSFWMLPWLFITMYLYIMTSIIASTQFSLVHFTSSYCNASGKQFISNTFLVVPQIGHTFSLSNPSHDAWIPLSRCLHTPFFHNNMQDVNLMTLLPKDSELL